MKDYNFNYYGRKTLWWDQRAKLHKFQAESLRQIRLKGSRYSSGFRGSPKQAICPFCYKMFYDKSTMNRHVSKRVCLGLQFQVSFADGVPNVPVTSVMPLNSSSLLYNEKAVSPDPVDEVSEVIMETASKSQEMSIKSEEIINKSGKVPCPYCHKLFKGDRGVRKHIDFYGCPMAVGSKYKIEH